MTLLQPGDDDAVVVACVRSASRAYPTVPLTAAHKASIRSSSTSISSISHIWSEVRVKPDCWTLRQASSNRSNTIILFVFSLLQGREHLNLECEVRSYPIGQRSGNLVTYNKQQKQNDVRVCGPCASEGVPVTLVANTTKKGRNALPPLHTEIGRKLQQWTSKGFSTVATSITRRTEKWQHTR